MKLKNPVNSALRLTPAMGVMSVAVMAVAADGHWKKREIERLRMMAYLQPLFQDIDSIESFVAQRAADLRSLGPKALMEACRKALAPSLRETAYAWAAELVQVDGFVNSDEHAFLRALAEEFKIPGQLARKIQIVAAIRRRTA